MMRRLLITCALLAFAPLAEAKPIITDLSQREIVIQTEFQGAELMVFGARNDPGDIIVIVRGPEKNATIRKKERHWGIWVNRHGEKFNGIPGFYAIASSRPLEEITKSAYFPLLGIGEENVLGVADPNETLRRKDYRRAMLRELRAKRLYYQNSETFSLIGETLFKTSIPFPDTTPPGLYTAEVYLVSDGEISAAHITPIRIFKSGIDASIFDLAHKQPTLYGIAAVFLALAGGWAAATLFNRR